MDDDAFDAQVILFLHALVERRRLAALTQEAREAFHDVAAGRMSARGGEALRDIIPADSRFWDIVDANRAEYHAALASVRSGGTGARGEGATLRTAIAALLEITNAGEVYTALDAVLP
jgi:hypothetical protein